MSLFIICLGSFTMYNYNKLQLQFIAYDYKKLCRFS